jgi:epoxyqueuosine reductase
MARGKETSREGAGARPAEEGIQAALWREIEAILETAGARFRRVPALRGEEAIREIHSRRDSGELSPALFERYARSFAFGLPEGTREDSTLIVLSLADPLRFCRFRLEERELRIPIPPTYQDHGEIPAILGTIRERLAPAGYRATPVRLPCKLMATRSGLGVYGRNNICYVPGFGSFHRLGTLLTDLPCPPGSTWGEPGRLSLCEDCGRCVAACPAGCFREDRFLLDATRCLTFHNEWAFPLPERIRPEWHNAWMGCLRCQLVCPGDREVERRAEEGERFSEEETRTILAARTAGDLTTPLRERLEALGLEDYLPVLGRNLRLLLPRRVSGAPVAPGP